MRSRAARSTAVTTSGRLRDPARRWPSRALATCAMTTPAGWSGNSAISRSTRFSSSWRVRRADAARCSLIRQLRLIRALAAIAPAGGSPAASIRLRSELAGLCARSARAPDRQEPARLSALGQRGDTQRHWPVRARSHGLSSARCATPAHASPLGFVSGRFGYNVVTRHVGWSALIRDGVLRLWTARPYEIHGRLPSRGANGETDLCTSGLYRT